jgi:hypothetical protein
MGFPIPSERFTRNLNIAALAVNTKEDEAILNLLFQGNHIARQRHKQRVLKLISMIEAI